MSDHGTELPFFNSAEALERVGGDVSFLRELVDVFLAGMPEAIRNVTEAVHAKSSERLVESAHALKSALGNLSAIRAHEYARQIEKIAILEDFEEALRLLALLEKSIDGFLQSVEKDLRDN
ncbi:Hpt domain-containing protein [bacterium]|nr:Hpt domain-containing protein [bacterium]